MKKTKIANANNQPNYGHDHNSERVLHINGTGALSNFTIKYTKFYSHFKDTQKRDSKTNCKSPTTLWDFYSLNPECLNQVKILMNVRGTPFLDRQLHGFGSHAFSLIHNKMKSLGNNKTRTI